MEGEERDIYAVFIISPRGGGGVRGVPVRFMCILSGN